MTTTYSNRNESANVIMDGECLGLHLKGKTCVRKTTCGQFAVIATTGTRLIKLLAGEWHARRYNFAIHGDTLTH